jgi:hypothetical protein
MDIVLIIALIALPAWLPIVISRNWQLAPRGSTAIILALSLFTVSEVLQLLLTVFVNFGLIPLAYSLKFAAVGFPCALLALTTAVIAGTKKSVGITVSSTLSIVAWLFLVTLH